MRVINIVSGTEKIRFGVWTAASITAPYLLENHNVKSELWYPNTPDCEEVPEIENIRFEKTESWKDLMRRRNLNPKKDIIISHCSWGYQTKWGRKLQKAGFKWIFVPHGTLEPWSLAQKRIKKKIYLNLVEKPLILASDAVRAISTPEINNLRSLLPGKRIELIPNGIDITEFAKVGIENTTIKPERENVFFFLARLHHKKGVTPLVEAWVKSNLNNSDNHLLIIAGPDEGELDKVNHWIAKSNNIRYTGPVYGEEKENLLMSSHYYVLPSKSEGFPVSVLEALSYGKACLITDGCNFPELFEQGLAYRITPEVNDIVRGLESIEEWKKQNNSKIQNGVRDFIDEQYSLRVIAKKQSELYANLLKTS